MLDLGRLAEDRTRWVPIDGALAGMEICVRHVGPARKDALRQEMIRKRVIQDHPLFYNPQPGKEREMYRTLASEYIVDWKGPFASQGKELPEPPPYNVDQMGEVLARFQCAVDALMRALAQEADFFAESSRASSE